ncbi:hypothetical protein LXA43DRAFT_889863 [Ganoderma leucocontextum]|nr:hypothetical protein LXA43DRAFT_889863 [Ganoderma leucocontextum]
MAKKKTVQTDKDTAPPPPPLPKIPWTANHSAIIWSLVSEMERTENRKVLFGKKSDENSSPEHKISVCKRIAKAIVLNLYSLNATVAGERVRSKIATEIQWEFFPRMHRLLCDRPNMVPPAVTTGVGPQARASTVYYQAQPSTASTAAAQPPPVSDDNIDPRLRDLDINSAALSHSRPVTEDTPVLSVMPGSSQLAVDAPSSKEKLSLAMQKASASIKPLSNKKRTFEEQLVDISEKNMVMANKRLTEESKEKRQKLSLKRREVLLEKHRAGLITRDEYRALVYGGKGKQPPTLDSSAAAMRSPPPLLDDDEPGSAEPSGRGVGGSDDIVGDGWEL